LGVVFKIYTIYRELFNNVWVREITHSLSGIMLAKHLANLCSV